MPLTDDYRLQDTFSRACRSTTWSSESASRVEHDYSIDVYHWWLPTATADAGSRSSNQCQLMSGSSTARTNSDNERNQNMTYECGTGCQVGCCMTSGVEIRRNSGSRLGSGGNGSIEFRNSELEESYQFGVPFFYFFSSHLFSILCYILGSRPGIHGVGMCFTISGSQSMGSGVFPRAVSTERLQYGDNW